MAKPLLRKIPIILASLGHRRLQDSIMCSTHTNFPQWVMEALACLSLAIRFLFIILSVEEDYDKQKALIFVSCPRIRYWLSKIFHKIPTGVEILNRGHSNLNPLTLETSPGPCVSSSPPLASNELLGKGHRDGHHFSRYKSVVVCLPIISAEETYLSSYFQLKKAPQVMLLS